MQKKAIQFWYLVTFLLTRHESELRRLEGLIDQKSCLTHFFSHLPGKHGFLTRPQYWPIVINKL